MKKYYRKDFLRPPSLPTSLPYKVRVAGFMESSPYHATLGTYNNDAMITLFIGGRGQYALSKEIIQIFPGMMGIVLPDEEIGILSSDKNDPYEHYYCRFAGTEALKIAKMLRMQKPKPFFEISDWAQLSETFEKLLSLYKRYKNRSGNIEKLYPVDAALALLLSLIEFPNGDEEQKLSTDDLIRYVSERISYPVDLYKMSLYFNLSKEHLCRIGKKLLGETIYNYWFKSKMRWALKLLNETDDSIADIALKCGYKDPFYFSRAFKSYYGASPRKIKKINSKSKIKDSDS